MRFAIAATLALLSIPALAQQAPAPAWTPIVLDKPKFDAFYEKLIDIDMKPKTFQQIIALFQAMENQAVEDKAKADAAKAATPPPQ